MSPIELRDMGRTTDTLCASGSMLVQRVYQELPIPAQSLIEPEESDDAALRYAQGCCMRVIICEDL